jgi:phosphoserine phosphatase
MLKKKHGYSNVVLIGDGATDLEASPPADAFIGKFT